jgi:putative ABC transport system permease protein
LPRSPVGPSGQADAAVGAGPVAVLGYSFWRRTFSGDLNAVGRIVSVEGVPLRIIGIAPQGFTGLSVMVEPDVTVPLPAWFEVTGRSREALTSGNILIINTVGRLKPDVTIARARAHLIAIWPGIKNRVAASTPINMDRAGFLTLPLSITSAATGLDSVMRQRYIQPLYVVLAIALLIVLIASLNLASLMLSRAALRDRDIAIRLALGASRWRVSRYLMTEGVVVAAMSIAGSLALASSARPRSRRSC